MTNEHHIHTDYRLITNYSIGVGHVPVKVELSSNIPTMEIAEKVRSEYYVRFPELGGIQIEEYYTLVVARAHCKYTTSTTPFARANEKGTSIEAPF